MKFSRTRQANMAALLVFAIALTGCGGTKILKEPIPFVEVEPISSSSDGQLNSIVDWVIVRDGPGTWARNADWDEYMIRVENTGAERYEIVSIAIVDSTGFLVESRQSRKLLVKGSKQTKRRYKGDGIKVKAGLSGTALVGAGVATYAVALPSAYIGIAGSSAAAAGSVVAVVVAPIALAAGGITRGVRNSKVNSEIEKRQAAFPVELNPGETKALHVFFPLAPSPQEVRITYSGAQGQEVLVVDVGETLRGLHMADESE